MRRALPDINRASFDDLASIDGITAPTARAVIEFISSNGAIPGISELECVSGVGPATLKKLQKAFSVKPLPADSKPEILKSAGTPQALAEFWLDQSTLSMRAFQSIFLARSMNEAMISQYEIALEQAELFNRTLQRMSMSPER
jgi:competence protein ComEA